MARPGIMQACCSSFRFQPTNCGSGSTATIMSFKPTWIILQMVPLLISTQGASDGLRVLPNSSLPGHYYMTDSSLWKHPNRGMSSDAVDIKATLLQPVFSGSGNTAAIMSFKHAWIILQVGYYAPVSQFCTNNFFLLVLPLSAGIFGIFSILWPHFLILLSGDVETNRGQQMKSCCN